MCKCLHSNDFISRAGFLSLKRVQTTTFSLIIVFDQICVYDQAYGEELADLLKLHDSVYEQASSWFTSLKDNMKSQILSHFGHLPSKDPDPQVSAPVNVFSFSIASHCRYKDKYKIINKLLFIY